MSWLKLHRSILKWEWYSDLPTRTVFLHLLLVVNRNSSTFRGANIPPASKVIGRKQLAIETGLSEQQVRRALKNLQTTKDITIKATKAYSVITVADWDRWQGEEKKEPSRQPRPEPQKNRKKTTVQEEQEYKNKKILKKEFEKEFEETFWPVAVKKKSIAAARKAYIAARAKTDMQAIMQSWRTHNAAWAEKKGTDDWEFIPYPATWLNAERWCDELEPTTVVRDPNRKTLTDFDSFGEYQEYLKTIGENA